MDSDPELEFPLYLLHTYLPGTKERLEESQLIRDLDRLGGTHGYSYLMELTERIEWVWRSSLSYPDPIADDEIRGIKDPAGISSTLKTLCDRHGYGRVPQLAYGLANIRSRGNHLLPMVGAYADQMGRNMVYQFYQKGLDDLEMYQSRSEVNLDRETTHGQ